MKYMKKQNSSEAIISLVARHRHAQSKPAAAVGVADDYAGLQVIDVSNPASPQRVGGYDTGEAHGVAVSGNVNSTNATPPGISWATASGNRNAINAPLP
jgi:hypothetical protein